MRTCNIRELQLIYYTYVGGVGPKDPRPHGFEPANVARTLLLHLTQDLHRVLELVVLERHQGVLRYREQRESLSSDVQKRREAIKHASQERVRATFSAKSLNFAGAGSVTHV